MKINPKQQTFEAIQWKDNCSEMKHFCGSYCTITYEHAPGLDDYWMLTVDTPNGSEGVPLHCWVIKLDDHTFIVMDDRDFKKYFDYDIEEIKDTQTECEIIWTNENA